MIKVALLAIAIMLLAMPALAVPENFTLGPYQVSFDAEKEPQDWSFAEKESETYSGVPYVGYNASSKSVKVDMICYSVPVAGIDPKQFRAGLGQKTEKLGCSFGTYLRTIDGQDRYVDHFDCFDGEMFVIQWWSTNQTLVTLKSFYPWDGGTLQLLKTIHIEKINSSISSQVNMLKMP